MNDDDDIGAPIREMTDRLSAEIAQFAKTIIEAHRSDLRTMLEPYVSLPARVEKLEAKARRRSSR